MTAFFSSVPFLIGLRYTRAKRRNQFISFVSGFSLVGMALGVMALIIVMSVLNGFNREIRDSVLSVIPHGFVESESPIVDWQTLASEIAQHSEVVASAPYVGGYGFISAIGNQGALIQGISPEAESQVSIVSERMLVGKLDYLREGDSGIILGKILANFVGATTGDKISVSTSRVTYTAAGPVLDTKTFTVVGVFEAGGGVDASLALIHLADAQKLFRYQNKVQGLHVKTKDILKANKILEELSQDLGEEYVVKDWTETQGSLFQALSMEKIVTTILLMTIIAIAAFNIITSLVLMVADKRADIAVLRTMGMTPRQVMRIFIIQGSAVGIFGTLVGVVFGVFGALYIGQIIEWFENLAGQRIFDPSVYFISHMPSELRLSDVVTVIFVSISLSVLATLSPSYRASRISPAEALRYE